MNKQELQARITQLEGIHAQTVARVNVIAGQIFELKYLIQEGDKRAGSPKPATLQSVEDVAKVPEAK